MSFCIGILKPTSKNHFGQKKLLALLSLYQNNENAKLYFQVSQMPLNVEPSPISRIREFGYQEAPPPTGGQLPAAGGVWVVPHFTGFTGITNIASRSYRFTFDEAMYESPYNARAMRRDPVLMSALRDRMIPCAMLRGHLEPDDETDKDQVECCAFLTKIMRQIKNFQQFKMHLLEATWYGRYGLQVLYEYDPVGSNPRSPNGMRMHVADYVPVNGDKLIFGWDKSIGILVNPTHLTGDIRNTERGRARFFNNRERESLVIHHFEPEDADFYDFEMSGAVNGIGVRGRLYWMWYLKTKILTLLMNYLQRVALGFTIYYYQAGNPESFNEVMTAAQNQVGGQAVLFPRLASGDANNGPGIERVEPSNSGAQLFEAIVTRYFDDIMRSYIMGQTLTTEAVSTGLGSGVAQAHEATFNRIVTYDATNLDSTITTELIAVLNRWNCPGNPCPRYVSDIERPDVASYMQAIQQLFSMGIELDVDDMFSVAGISQPVPGHKTVSMEKFLTMQANIQAASQQKMAAMQPQPGQNGKPPSKNGKPDKGDGEDERAKDELAGVERKPGSMPVPIQMARRKLWMPRASSHNYPLI